MRQSQGSKATVLAIHGSASSGHQWRSLRAALEGDCNIIAPDMPGYGPRRDLSKGVDRMHYFWTLMEQATGSVDLVAHSFGGAVALALANAFPSKTRSVLLYDPVIAIPIAGGGNKLPTDLAALWYYVQSTCGAAAMEAFMCYWSAPSVWAAMSEEQRARLLLHETALRRDFSEITSGYWTPVDTVYQGPMRVFCGEKSPSAIRQICGYLARAYPQSDITTLAGLDHMAPLSRPGQFDAALKDSLIGSPTQNLSRYAA